MFDNPAMIVVFLLGQLLAWHFIRKRLRHPASKIALTVFYILVNALALYVLYGFYFAPNPPPNNPILWNYIYRPIYIWELIHALWLAPALALTLLYKFFSLFWRRKTSGLTLFKNKRHKIGLFDIRFLLLLAMLGLAGYGYAHQLSAPEVEKVDIDIHSLPPSLENFSIALLSDLHYGRSLNSVQLGEILSAAAALKPDLVILAGDLVDRRAAFALDYRIPLMALRNVPNGVYGVMGNNEFKTDSPNDTANNLMAAGLILLRNQRVNLPQVPITLIGFDDPATNELIYQNNDDDFFNFTSLTGPVPDSDNLLILVNHRPAGVSQAAKQGVELMLSGHTHGGLFQSPWDKEVNIMSVFFNYPHSTGLYREKNLALYITRGLAGFSVPFRLWAWPEITLINLRSSPIRR